MHNNNSIESQVAIKFIIRLTQNYQQRNSPY